ncbi:MAG: hypothetical protein WAU62_04690 [Dehalococcoidales bacterium]|jgi:hypothetical protein
MNKNIRAILAGFLVVVFSVIFSACGSTAKTTTTSTPLPVGPQTLPIVDSTGATPNYISIPLETNQNYTFIIAKNMTAASVTGYFNCTGGSPNLIEVYLMNDATYAKWLKNPGGQSTILYDSEEMSAGALNQTNLPPGTYHLVFSNKSSDATQDVVTKIDLNWTYSQ